MWLSCYVLLLAFSAWRAWRQGPYRAVGATAILALLIPTWIATELWGMPLDLRIAGGITALAIYCIHPKAKFRTRLVLVDYAGIALIVVHLTSDWWNDGFDWFVPLRAYGEWAVPYLLGRLAFQRWDDVRELAPFAVAVCLIFACEALIETFTRQNVFELIFGVRTTEMAARLNIRWGLQRAWGPTFNPIYYGTLLLLLFPWTLFAAAVGLRRTGPRWWLATPFVTIVGILCTVSRAPILGIVIVLYAIATILIKRVRPYLLGAAILGVCVLGFKYDAVLDALHSWSGESSESRPILVDGEKVKYSGTLHRVYLFKVYGTAMRRAGWIGFGTDSTSTFPPRIPVGVQDAATLKKVWSIDNEYILLWLRFGILGVTCFSTMGLAAIASYISLARSQGLRFGVFSAAMAGGLLATMSLLMTVWMPHDFGFWFLWTMGTSAALRSRMISRHDH